MKLLTLKEVGERVGLAEVTLRRKVKEGSLPAIRLGRAIRVVDQDLALWIEAIRVVDQDLLKEEK